MAKYWFANNPNAECTNAEATALGALSQTEIELLDGASAGTVVASKSVVYNSSGAVVTTGVLDNNVASQSGTGAEDLSATASNLVWYSNSAQAAAITLPQATSANIGMVIKIIVGTTDWSGSQFKLGFTDAGSTVLTGYMRLGSNAGSETVDGFVITANAKVLLIDADEPTASGGAIGSTYTFTYLKANLVHCEGNGQVTTGTPALDSGAFSTTGI